MVHKHARVEEQEGVSNENGVPDDLLRHSAPKRAKVIDQDPPLQELASLIKELKDDGKVKTVLHWFRSKDLRQEDNKALAAASDKAQEGDKLITVYLHSPEDLQWHGTSPARSDFIFENLRILQKQLQDKNIPLVILTSEQRGEKQQTLMDFLKEQEVSHVFANYEYEVDELRRDITLAKALLDGSDGITFSLYHDQTVVTPGELSGKVFTPYYKVWTGHVAKKPELLDLVDDPKANDKSVKKEYKKLFESKIPTLPKDKQFESDEEKKRIRKLWPAGHDAAMKRLDQFLKEKIADYKDNRSNPALDCTSRLSAYFSAGVISVREVLAKTKEHNNGEDNFTAGGEGVAKWIRELVFREFYRHTLSETPHDSMNLPHNLKFDFVQWETGDEADKNYQAWEDGKTGMPFIDAGMRQIKHEAYMHNRLRMNTASYLRMNLLLDYRRGERYFAETLIDWDLSNNTRGWEPSYTAFNPVIQAEKNDPQGDYIRRWVPELKDVKGKAIFMPFERLSPEEFKKLGYPEPIVDFKESAARAKERYKQDLHSAEAEEL